VADDLPGGGVHARLGRHVGGEQPVPLAGLEVGQRRAQRRQVAIDQRQTRAVLEEVPRHRLAERARGAGQDDGPGDGSTFHG
jgi:hypothetical protein